MLIFIQKVIYIYCSHIARNRKERKTKKKRTMMMILTGRDYKIYRDTPTQQKVYEKKKIPWNQWHEGQQYQRLIYWLNKIKSHVFPKSPTGEREGENNYFKTDENAMLNETDRTSKKRF
jgi:hypothetical protein